MTQHEGKMAKKGKGVKGKKQKGAVPRLSPWNSDDEESGPEVHQVRSLPRRKTHGHQRVKNEVELPIASLLTAPKHSMTHIKQAPEKSPSQGQGLTMKLFRALPKYDPVMHVYNSWDPKVCLPTEVSITLTYLFEGRSRI
jgi:hypothetical protein